MKIRILPALLLCLLGLISTKLILNLVKKHKVNNNEEKKLTFEEEVVTFFEKYIEKPKKSNDDFLDKIKKWIVPEETFEKKTIFGQVKIIYLQKRSKIVGECAITSILLALVEHYMASTAGKYL